MTSRTRSKVVCVFLCILVVACAGEQGQSDGQQEMIDEQQVIDAAWRAFEPNTSSQNRANWEVVQVRTVSGRDVAEQFAGEPAPGCWVGPTPSPNGDIDAAETYWYVYMRARLVTPPSATRTVSPTAPPAIPEAFVREAWFLLGRSDGQVVARKIYCVIY
ncbi:MAG: hypothetical protein JXA89_22640 [Anaerolineae bacterium]|nr:hypothetical protein [Anaerolineae bacterium]